jgi:hypothetical protein
VLTSSPQTFGSGTRWRSTFAVFREPLREVKTQRFDENIIRLPPEIRLPVLWLADTSGITPTIEPIFDGFSDFRIEKTVEKSNGKSLWKDEKKTQKDFSVFKGKEIE